MADVPEEVCVFCKEGEEAGSLRNTSNEEILAHHNCLLFSPGVVTKPQEDSQDNTAEFDIPSVIKEIKRGKKLNCSYCNKKGATVGCNNRWCRKTYHYLCVTKAKGIRIRDEDKERYIAYCYKHARKDQFAKDAQLNNGAETSETFIPPGCSNKARKNKTLKKNKRKRVMKHKIARKKLRFDRMPNPGTVRNAEMGHDLDNRTNEDNMEVPGPSTTCLLHIDFYIRSDSGSNVELSNGSNGSNSAQIGAEQNPGMRTEPESMHMLSDHTYHEQMKALEPSPTLQQQTTIVIRSDSETEDELPVFTNTKEGVGTSAKDDTTVMDTSSRLLQETLLSPVRERMSSLSTDSSGPCTPEIFRSVSLSGFPTKNKKRKRKRNNPELEAALLNMPHEERDAYSLLYDEVGGSLDISTYDCDVEQIKDASNETVENIPEDHHTGTKACSDGNNQKFAALESSVSTRTPGPFASSTPLHDATSVSQLPRHSSGVTNDPSRQFANITNIALAPTVNSHNLDVPVDQTETIYKRPSQSVAHLSPITTGTEMLIGQTSCSSFASNKCTGMSASSPRAKNAFLQKELPIKGASISREVPPTSTHINSGKAIEVQNAACNSSSLHIKTLSHLPRHSPGVTSSPSGQFINIASKVKNPDSLQGTTFNPVNVAYNSNWLSSISGEMLTSEDSAAGENNARAKPTNTCNGKDKLVSTSAVYHNPTKPLVIQPLSSSSRIKASDKQQLMKCPNNNISSEQHNIHTKNKDLMLQSLGKTVMKPEEQHFSRHAPSITLGPANTDILQGKEPLSSPSVSKKSNVQPMNPQFTSKESEEQCKQSPGFSQSSGEQSTRNVLTTKALVHTVNSHESDVPVDLRATVLKKQSQSVAHLSAITTGTDLLIGQTSSSSIINNKCMEISASSPRAKEAFPVKESLIKAAPVSREEVLPTPPGIQASEVQNATCHPSPLHIKAFSDQLKRGFFHKTFKNITVQFPSNAKSVVTSLSKLQSKEGGPTSEQTSEHCIVSQQQTRTYLSSVAGDLRNSGQTADEPASPDKPPKDECMLVEEITHADDDTVLLYVDAGQTLDKPASPSSDQENGCKCVEEIKHADEDTALLYGQKTGEPASPGKPPEDGPMLVEKITHADEDTVLLYGQTLDKPASPCDLEENECMSVEETHTDEDPVIRSDTTNVAVLITKSSQTETSSGFPTNVDKPMNLSTDQKNKLIESYKEAEKQMSRTGDTTKAVRAFWDLCRENRCQEFLLTLTICYMKSVLYKIVHEEPKDRDFEQAFAFLQASGCFADFTNGTEDVGAKNNSRTTSIETYNESDSDSAGSCKEVKNQGEITRDEDPDGMESESCESSQMSNKVGQYTRDEGHNKVQTECSKTSLLSVNNNVKESSGDEDHNGMQSELCQSSLESNKKEESCRGKENDDIQSELRESCSESSRKVEPCRGEDHDGIQCELSESLSESNRKEESSRCEDHYIVQSELCESRLQSSKKAESCRGEGYDDIQSASSERSRKTKSTEDDDLDRMEMESPAASLFSPSASSKSDLVLSENGSRRRRVLEEIQLKTMKTNLRVLKVQLQNLQSQQQQQPEDADVGFATNLIQFLRRVPEDKKLSTQMSILNVLSSVLGQQPMSI
ncbi:uncharacterized protein LOC143984009 isoform X2 [Lithobates pipiens]